MIVLPLIWDVLGVFSKAPRGLYILISSVKSALYRGRLYLPSPFKAPSTYMLLFHNKTQPDTDKQTAVVMELSEILFKVFLLC